MRKKQDGDDDGDDGERVRALSRVQTSRIGTSASVAFTNGMIESEDFLQQFSVITRIV